MARAFSKHGLRLGVEISYAPIAGYEKYPFIEAASWVEALDRNSRLDRLIGSCGAATSTSMSATLKAFWQNYRLDHPSHQIFSSNLQLEDCIPVYLHGDEGTTYKKDGALCISLQSPLGRGTSTTKLGQLDGLDDSVRQKLNYLGHAFETRFLMIAGLKDSLSHYAYNWGVVKPWGLLF